MISSKEFDSPLKVFSGEVVHGAGVEVQREVVVEHVVDLAAAAVRVAADVKAEISKSPFNRCFDLAPDLVAHVAQFLALLTSDLILKFYII